MNFKTRKYSVCVALLLIKFKLFIITINNNVKKNDDEMKCCSRIYDDDDDDVNVLPNYAPLFVELERLA